METRDIAEHAQWRIRDIERVATELDALPEQSNREVSRKESIEILLPQIERLRRGQYTLAEIAGHLTKRGVEITTAQLRSCLGELKRAKRKGGRRQRTRASAGGLRMAPPEQTAPGLRDDVGREGGENGAEEDLKQREQAEGGEREEPRAGGTLNSGRGEDAEPAKREDAQDSEEATTKADSELASPEVERWTEPTELLVEAGAEPGGDLDDNEWASEEGGNETAEGFDEGSRQRERVSPPEDA